MVHKEIQAASWFLASNLNPNVKPLLSQEQIHAFQNELALAMEQKYVNHWHPDIPERGHAFRSILVEHQRLIDELILTSAQRAKVPNVARRLTHLPSLIMWIDPYNVTVQYLPTNRQQVIYDSKPLPSSVSFNPAETTIVQTDKKKLFIQQIPASMCRIPDSPNVGSYLIRAGDSH
jgi:protein Tob/BTG